MCTVVTSPPTTAPAATRSGEWWFTTAPLLALLVFGLTFWFYFRQLKMGEAMGSELTQDVAAVQANKILWGGSALALVNVLVWSLIVSGRILRDVVPSWPEGKQLGFLLSVFLLCICALGLAVYQEFGGQAAVGLIQHIQQVAKVEMLPLIGLTNFLALLVVVLTTATCCALCAPWGVDSTEAVASRIWAFRLAQYVSAAVLVVGLIEIVMLFKWGAVCAAAQEALSRSKPVEAVAVAAGQSPTAPPLAQVAQSLPLTAGLIFTTLLAVLYLPVAVVLQRRLHTFMVAEAKLSPEFKATEWLDRFGLEERPMAVLGGALAVLAPALTGVATHFLK